MEDPYKKFAGRLISEEAFRREWGKRYDELIEYRNHLNTTGHPQKALRVEAELQILDSIFLRLEEMRVLTP